MHVKSISNEQLGARLRTLRKKRGLSIREAGQLLGYSRSQISNLERGISTITAQQLYSFCDAYDVSTGYFFPEFENCPEKTQFPSRFHKSSQFNEQFSVCEQEILEQLLVLQERCGLTQPCGGYKGKSPLAAEHPPPGRRASHRFEP